LAVEFYSGILFISDIFPWLREPDKSIDLGAPKSIEWLGLKIGQWKG
jgi:hypothetical protein